MRRLNSQALILIGAIVFVVYLAGIPLLMLLYGSIRSAPIGEPGATYTIQNYVRAYVDKEFYLLFLNSLYFAVGTCALTCLIGTFGVGQRTNEYSVEKGVRRHGAGPVHHSGDSQHHFMDSSPQS